MHKQAYAYVEKAAGQLALDGAQVLEIGSLDVNGTVRPLFEAAKDYIGIDHREGRGVDVVTESFDGAESFDVAVCCEVLEHAKDPQGVIATAWQALVPGGTLILTAAGPGRKPHNTMGGGNLGSEHYASITPADLRAWLKMWGDVAVSEDTQAGDVYAVARKLERKRKRKRKYETESGLTIEKRGDESPFLSVVTRSYMRPQALAANKASLDAQTVPDFEQIFVINTADIGSIKAYANIPAAIPHITGEYVLILDDDDRLKDPAAIQKLMQATSGGADVVIFKGVWPDGRILPDKGWGDAPVVSHIGSPNFIVNADAWKSHAPIFADNPRAESDFDFIAAVCAVSDSVCWLNDVLVEVAHGGGKAEQ